MRSPEETVRHDELPTEVENTGQTCEHGATDPCGAPADVSIWMDFGVHRHSWTEWTVLCARHFGAEVLPYYGRALPLTKYAIETPGLDGPTNE